MSFAHPVKQFAIDILGDARKSAVQLLIASVAASGVAASTTAKLWCSLLSIPDSQVSSIRYWLLVAGSLALIAVAVGFYVRTFRRLRAVEKQLADSLAVPRKVSDDYEHLKDRAFWVHRKTGERVCGNCLVSHSIVSPLAIAAKTRLDRSRYLVWRCGRKECGMTYAKRDSDA